LTDVDASQCGIGDVGASALASAIDDARAEAVERVVHGANAWSSGSDFIDGMTAAAAADDDGFGFGLGFGRRLGEEAAGPSRGLRGCGFGALKLGFNGITGVGATALSGALRRAQDVSILDARVEVCGQPGPSPGPGSAPSPPPPHLPRARGTISRSSRRAVVRSLDLKCNALGPEGVVAIANCLDAVSDELDVSNNDGGDAGAKVLSRALKRDPPLRSLRLAANDVGPEGAWWIADALGANDDLRELDVSSNPRVGDGGARDVAEELKARSISHWSPYDRVGVVNADP
jgi:hypothetical protein